MKPSRFQPLSPMFEDLRALLYKTMRTLHNTDFTTKDASFAIQNTTAVLEYFEYQTAIEEALLLSAVHDYEPMVEAILRDDHRNRIKKIQQLQQMIANAYDEGDSFATWLFSSRLIRRFNEFAISCMQQMHSHESMLTPVLWRYYSDRELKQITRSVKSAHEAISSLPDALGFEALALGA